MASAKIATSNPKPLVKMSHPLKTETGVLVAHHSNPSPSDNKSVAQFLHNPGLATDWSAQEQSILDDNLTKFANETNLWKYIKIAALLPEKTVRDVALRCKWMAKKEMGKRRKVEEQNLAKKSKDKKDKIMDAISRPITKSSMPLYTPPPLPIDTDDGISNDAIGGTAGELFDQNVQVIVQIRANLAACKAQENTELLARFRDNLYAIFNGMTNVPGIMRQMPPLPVPINTELADSILPKSMHQPSPLQS